MENVVRMRKNHIVAINTPQNGEYSFKNGSSLINFFLPSAPVALLTQSLKLNFKLRVNKPSSTFQNPVLVNNNANKGGTEYNLTMDERVGVGSIIDTITWSSGNTQQTLENIRGYGRLLSTTNPYHNSQYKMDGMVQGGNSVCSSRSKISANLVNTEIFCSIDLKCGLLEGVRDGIILMGNNGVNGLNLLIQLQNDQMTFLSKNSGTSLPETDAVDAFYSINSVNLSYNTLEFTPEVTEELQKPSKGEMSYASYSYIYSVINSADDQQVLNLGGKNTLSIFTSSLPTSHLNNIKHNSFSTGNLKNATNGVYDQDAILKRVSFVRNGELSPYNNFIEVTESSTNNTPRPVIIDSAKQALDVSNSTETLISPATENNLLTRTNIDGNEVFSMNVAVSTETQSNPCVAYGVNFDNIGGVGRNFSGNNTYGLRLQSSLSGNAPNSLTSFVRSRNTLIYDNSSISVVS